MAQGRKEMSPKDIRKANNRDLFLIRSLRAFRGNEEEVENAAKRFEEKRGRVPTDAEMENIRLLFRGKVDSNISDLQRRISLRGQAKKVNTLDYFDDDTEMDFVEAKTAREA